MPTSVQSDRTTKPETLCDLFTQAVTKYRDLVAICAEGGRGRQYTYGDVLRLVESVTAFLLQPRFAGQNRIGLYAENRAEWPMAYLAILAAGKTVVPIDVNLKPSEVAHIIGHSQLTTIFTAGACRKLLEKEHPAVAILAMDDTFSSLTAEPVARPARPSSREETASLIYTSGTMGDPKAVILTHRNLLANLDSVTRAIHFGVGDIFLSVLPLNHVFEATCGFLSPLTRGSTVVYARSLKSREILEDIAANRVSLMCGVPLLFEKMYRSIQRGIAGAPAHRRAIFKVLFALSGLGWRFGGRWGRALFRPIRYTAGLGSVRMFVSGAAAIPPHISRFFNYLGIDFIQGYGMTECSPVISVNRIDDLKFDSVGRPLDCFELKIAEPDEGGEGEIVVRGEAVTPGYWQNPAKTAELIHGDWLYTGDLGVFRDGHLWITGRAKNVIVSAAGKNIHPEELEEKLHESPFVLESVVFGHPKEGRQGEEVRAILVPDLEQFKLEFGMDPAQPDLQLIEATMESCVADVNDRVAGYKRIVGHEVQLQELVKTASKKIRRAVYNKR